MSLVYFMIGVPGVGKSTYRESNFSSSDYKIISSDDVIERIARHFNVSYNEAFKCADFAQYLIDIKLKKYITTGHNVVWDQTNISKKSRAKKLVLFPASYIKIALYFEAPPDIMTAKPYNRPGKIIPDTVVQNMIDHLEPPEKSEGFEEIRIIRRSQNSYKSKI